MEKEIRLDYLKRLFTPYKKEGKWECFLLQYLEGSGNELKEKFWSPMSSSRLCFDLYSWMGSDPEYKVIEFEKKLPGIVSKGREVHPNMDVYFETNDGIYFIESKYTETAQNHEYLNALPEAYWKTDEVYKNSKGKETTYSISLRYHQKDDVKKAFLEFIDDIQKEAIKEEKKSWFDAKQETCHLLGIVLLESEEKPTKPIRFLNIAANYEYDTFAEYFRSKAEAMVNQLFVSNSVNASFEYRLCSVKDFFGNSFLDKKGYQTDKTIREILADRKRYLQDPLCPPHR